MLLVKLICTDPYFTETKVKINMVFEAITRITTNFDPSVEAIHSLFWVPLIATTSNSSFLRLSALRLLRKLFNLSLSNGKTINSLRETRKQSQKINEAISDVEKLKNVDFENYFIMSLVILLTKSIIDPETRGITFACLDMLSENLTSDLNEASTLLLPFIAFDNIDTDAVLLKFNVSSIQEAVFYGFENKSQEEKTKIVQYLAAVFGLSNQTNNISIITSCFLYGIQHFKDEFVAYSSVIIGKLWKILTLDSFMAYANNVLNVIALYYYKSEKTPYIQQLKIKESRKRQEKEVNKFNAIQRKVKKLEMEIEKDKIKQMKRQEEEEEKEKIEIFLKLEKTLSLEMTGEMECSIDLNLSSKGFTELISKSNE